MINRNPTGQPNQNQLIQNQNQISDEQRRSTAEYAWKKAEYYRKRVHNQKVLGLDFDICQKQHEKWLETHEKRKANQNL